MNRQPHTWRFRFSGDPAAGTRPGLASTPGGAPKFVAGDAAIRQSLMLLLSTRPGERVMRPDWGCPLHRVLFQPNDGTTAGLAMHYVRQAVARFEPRAEVLALDAGPDGDTVLRISMLYRVIGTGAVENLAFDVSLEGAGA